jgi:hypothetical protein
MSEFEYEDVNVSIERNILTGLIVSTEFVREIVTIYNHTFFQNRAAKKLARWAISYYKQYGKCPGKDIQSIYDSNVRKGILQESEEDYIANILEGLSSDWEHNQENFNVEYLLDEAESFFSQRNMQMLADDIKNALSNGDIEDAQDIISRYKMVARPKTRGVDPFTDEERIIAAFEKSSKPLFKMPGAAGQILNTHLFRTGFVAFQAPEKVGKSFWLQEMAIRAVRQRCKVAIFEMGDMSEADRICRIHSYIAKRPFDRDKQEGDIVDIKIPSLIEEDGEYIITYTEDKARVIGPGYAVKNGKIWSKRIKGRIKIAEYPSDTGSITDISNVLDKWEVYENFIPDVVIIDYADIVAPEDTSKSERGQINDIWKAMRRLAQQRQCLVLTATQADAKSYNVSSQTRKNYSEDKRKYSHVTAIFSLNQTPQEKVNGVLRIGTILAREGKWHPTMEAVVVQCLDIGRPYIDSYVTFADHYDNDDE